MGQEEDADDDQGSTDAVPEADALLEDEEGQDHREDDLQGTDQGSVAGANCFDALQDEKVGGDPG